MWRIIGFLLLASQISFGASIKATTWNLEWFPNGSPTTATPEVQNGRIKAAADVLRSIDPDIILLQEVLDYETCERLVRQLRPAVYHVAACSAFKEQVGGVGRQQVAVLAKTPAIAAWSDKWTSLGKVDPPRGFAFALFKYGTNQVAVYSVHLKSNRTKTSQEMQLNIRKREICAEQLLDHIQGLPKLLKIDKPIVVLGGDFNTNPDNKLFVSEKTLQLLQKNGFASGFESLPLKARITCPREGRYPDATFDYVFVRPAALGTNTMVFKSNVSDHFPVTRIIDLGRR